MRRRIRDADRHLTENATLLNPEAYRQYRQEVTQAQAAAVTFADKAAKRRYEIISERRTDLLQDMCGVRDQLAELAKEGRAGRIDAAEYTARLERLSAAYDQAMGARGVQLVSDAVESIADIEQGPRQVLATDDGAPNLYGDRPEEWSPADYFDSFNDRHGATDRTGHPEFSF